jgi:predicted acetyltransferase
MDEREFGEATVMTRIENMRLQVVEAARKHQTVLRHLFELYAHDFSPMTGEDVNEATGMWTDDAFLANGWNDPHFHPYLLKADGKWAGFAWVEWGSYINPDDDAHWLMEEFFIMRKYRQQGIGEWFARALFARHAGTWEVGEIHENEPAQHFWRKVIGRYAGVFDEVIVDNDRWTGPVQRFSSPSRRMSSSHQV